jgi:hypothetical protein
MIWGPFHFTKAPREGGRSANTPRYISRCRAKFPKRCGNKELRRFGEPCDRFSKLSIVALKRHLIEYWLSA